MDVVVVGETHRVSPGNRSELRSCQEHRPLPLAVGAVGVVGAAGAVGVCISVGVGGGGERRGSAGGARHQLLQVAQVILMLFINLHNAFASA